jgi:hypothetical protein
VNFAEGTLTLAPRSGARPGSPQSRATDTITGNLASRGRGGLGGAGGGAVGGRGRFVDDPTGLAIPGGLGIQGDNGIGGGGGLARNRRGHVTITDTNVTGNHATTQGNDVFDTDVT